jgi:hypothetical protein
MNEEMKESLYQEFTNKNVVDKKMKFLTVHYYKEKCYFKHIYLTVTNKSRISLLWDEQRISKSELKSMLKHTIVINDTILSHIKDLERFGIHKERACDMSIIELYNVFKSQCCALDL